MTPVHQLQEEINTKADGIIGRNTLLKWAQHNNKNRAQTAHFFGQCAHETMGFQLWEENLNYSAKALMRVFRHYFLNWEEAEAAARKPEKIANIVYSCRMGNGRPTSGDGYKYRGRGAIQLTGKNNYQAFGKHINDLGIVVFPDKVSDQLAFQAAMFYFQVNGLWKDAEVMSVQAINRITKRINGGTHGLEDRKRRTYNYYEMLA